MTTRYDQLIAKHGTLQEFQAAVWNAVGEISIAEAQAGIEAYRRDLAEAQRLDTADQASTNHERA